MQHPQHDIATARNSVSSTRITGLAFVGALHAALIYALVMGLIPSVTKVFSPPLSVIDVPKKKIVDVPAPTTTPLLRTPQSVPAVPPLVVIDSGSDDRTITTTWNKESPPAGQAGDTPVRAVAGTHTTPDYPLMARRLGREGTVQLHLTIASDGTVSDAVVERSSGSDMLDQAAIDWVKAHWRYRPMLHNGAPVSSTTEAAVKFDLHRS